VAELTYSVRETRGQRSLLAVQPLTGRKHQIRAQLAAHGWPIVGDARYGARTRLETGIALVAWRLAFRHPVDEQDVDIVVPAHLDPTRAWLDARSGGS
jgi:23S rRNA pseudouridine1911/1915/1917 synthase